MPTPPVGPARTLVEKVPQAAPMPLRSFNVTETL
jgi:hypothetical protein